MAGAGEKPVKRIGVLTSGGDAPGMNAAVRAVVRMALEHQVEVIGILNGFAGMIDGRFRPLKDRDVGGILQHGGTILGSARSPAFKTEPGQQTALKNLEAQGIEGVIVIGGNGSQTGAYHLNKLGIPTVGVASTIDNDLIGSDVTIGVDTALNIALEAIDRLKVTASSHRRAFLVEVMGRDCGYLALMAGLAGGAEAILVPEIETSAEAVLSELAEGYKSGKTNAIIVVAEGSRLTTEQLLAFCSLNQESLGFDIRATTLGHVQRGGIPTAYDRVLASVLGAAAAERLLTGDAGVVVGRVESKVTFTPHVDVVGRTKGISADMYELARRLAR
jgi:6-phosphofructokinase 1